MTDPLQSAIVVEGLFPIAQRDNARFTIPPDSRTAIVLHESSVVTRSTLSESSVFLSDTAIIFWEQRDFMSPARNLVTSII